MESGVLAEQLVGRYTEIMPGRPTIAHHRCPYDDVRSTIDANRDSLFTKLCVGVISAAEQQTMNYYMNVCAAYPTDIGRRLYQEIGMIEEQHVTHYGSLMDPRETWTACLLMPRKVVRQLPDIAAVVLMGGVIWEAVVALNQLYGDGMPNHALYRFTGTFLNPGPFCGFMAIGVPLAVHYLVKSDERVQGSKFKV